MSQAAFPTAALRWAVVAVLLAYLVWNSLYYMPYTVDDAFISFRYARNLAEGNGLIYNPGERVEGFSSFSYVLVAAGIQRLGLPLLVWVKIFGLVCGMLTSLATYFFCRHLLREEPGRDLGGLLALALVSVNTGFAVWTQAGLETALYALLLVGAAWRFERELEGGGLPWSAVLVVALAMTRPESPLYFVYFAGRLIVRTRRTDSPGAGMRWLAVFFPLLLLYELWGLWYYGALLPNTYLAKLPRSGGGLLNVLAPPYTTSFFAGQGWGWLGLVGFGVVGIFLARRPRLAGVYIPILGGLAFALYAQADWMPRHRLLIPILPLLSIAIAVGFVRVVRAAPRPWFVVPVFVLGAACLADYFRIQAFGSDPSQEHTRGNYARLARDSWFGEVPRRVHERLYPIEDHAIEMATSVPENEYVLLRDIGFPGFFAGNPIWDVFGLVTPSAARARHDPSEAAQREAFEELMALRPGLILLRLGQEGSAARRLFARLEADSTVAREYESRGAAVPRTSWPWHTVAYRRRDLPAVDSAVALQRAIDRLDAPPSQKMKEALTDATGTADDAGSRGGWGAR